MRRDLRLGSMAAFATLLLAVALTPRSVSATMGTNIGKSSSGCAFAQSEQVEWASPGVQRLLIRAAGGSVRVTGGEAGEGKLLVHSEKCASSAEALANMRLAVSASSSVAEIVVSLPTELFSSEHGTIARTDLTVTVPGALDVVVVGAMHGVSVENVRRVELEANLGEASAKRIAGDVVVTRNTGRVLITDIRGSVEVSGGVGEVGIRDVGNVTISPGHAGPIAIEAVVGDVRVVDSTSGTISVTMVGGDLWAGGGLAERLQYAKINGKVVVGGDGRDERD